MKKTLLSTVVILLSIASYTELNAATDLLRKAITESLNNGEASKGNPADYTSAIINNNFDPEKGNKDEKRIDGWEVEGALNGYKSNTCSFNKGTFKLSQKLEGLPEGKYKVTVHTFYRAGGYEEEEANINAGKDTHLMKIFANTSDNNFEGNIMNLSEGSYGVTLPQGISTKTINGITVPDGTGASAKCFEAGLFLNELEFTVGDDGVATIGLKLDETIGSNDYSVVGEWNLYYYGNPNVLVLLDSYQLERADDGSYLIESVADWNALAEYIADSHENSCAGLTFKMTQDIGPVTRPLGRQTGKGHETRMRFAGTFDGAGHTLEINLTTDPEGNDIQNHFKFEKGYCSPFAYTQDATIKNLHVTGTVTTTGPWASGLVGHTSDEKTGGNCTIDSCQVSVDIIANYISDINNNAYGNHGGFIGIAEKGTISITNSWFDGCFHGKDYMYSAGFIGINKGAATINNCLFNPAEINIENNNIEGSCEFVHNLHKGSHTLTNAYWVSHFGEPENAQGQRIYTVKPSAQYEYITLDENSTPPTPDGNTYYKITKNKGWAALQEALNSGTEYTMTESLTAGPDDAALIVPKGVTSIINMEGYTIDRGLTLEPAQANGYVIKVAGNLTINGGTITGGNNNGNGGGIYNEGTLNINGITITGNFSKGHGAGIYNAGTLNINSATITDNTGRQEANRGLGIYATASAKSSIKGNVSISNNLYTYYAPIKKHTPHNIYLAGSSEVSVSRTFSNGVTSTICLPFPITSLTSGTLYEFSTVDFDDTEKEWVATYNEKNIDGENPAAAGNPYLFKQNSDGELTFSGTVSGNSEDGTNLSSTYGDWTFHGTYSTLEYDNDGKKQISGKVFGFAASAGTGEDANGNDASVVAGEFVRAMNGATIPPFRAYLTYEGSDDALQAPTRGGVSTPAVPERIKVRLLGSDGTETAVGTINTRTGEVVIDKWYDMSGRELQGKPNDGGLYIHNGKSVIIR